MKKAAWVILAPAFIAVILSFYLATAHSNQSISSRLPEVTAFSLGPDFCGDQPTKIWPNTNLFVLIDISECKLWLFATGDDGTEQLIKEYPVATAKKGIRSPVGLRKISRVQKDPWWFPTAATREAYKKKHKKDLPKKVPPGSASNALGKIKFFLAFPSGKEDSVYRIHGTNDDGSIGNRASRGCIRMHNSDALELAEIIRCSEDVSVYIQK